MADRYWVGSGGATWDSDSNWSDTPGGSGGFSYPVAGDNAYFTSDDNTGCKVDAANACATVTSTAGYTGALDLTNDSLTVSGDFTFQDGELDLGTGTLTVGGNIDLTGATVTDASGFLVLTGSTKTIAATNGEELYDLTVSGTYALNNSVVINNSIDVPGTLTIAAYTALTLATGATSDFTGGTIASGGENARIVVLNAGMLSAAGTINSQIRWQITSGSGIMPARTYGTDIRVERGFGAGDTTLVMGTAGSQTITINGNLYIDNDDSTSGDDLIVDGATYNPDVVVTGNIDYIGSGAGSESILAGDGTWTVGGNIDLTGGTFTPANSTVVLNGSSAQNVTSNGQSFYNLTSENTAGTNGVVFVDAVNITNVAKCWTANSILTFHDHATNTHVLNTTDFDGQAVGTRIVIQRKNDNGVAARWNVTTNTQMDYVDVSWNDASPGIQIVATNSNDGLNNTNWSFGVIYDETGRLQDLLITPSRSDAQTYVESRSQTVVIVLAESDAQTYAESQAQAVLMSQSRTDLQSYNTESVVQVVLMALAETDLQSYNAESPSQTILIVASETDFKTYIESVSQTVLMSQARSDLQAYIDSVAQSVLVAQSRSDVQVYNAESRSQVIFVAPVGSDTQVYNPESLTQGLLIDLLATDVKTYLETVSQTVLMAAFRTDVQGYVDALSQVLLMAPSRTDRQTYSDSLAQIVLVVPSRTDAQTYVEALVQALLIQASATDDAAFADSVSQVVLVVLSATDAVVTIEAFETIEIPIRMGGALLPS